MKFSSPTTLSALAEFLGAEFKGDAELEIFGVNEIHVASAGDVVFVDHPKYYDKTLASAATVVIINKDVDCPEGKGLIISKDPFSDFNRITRAHRPFEGSETPQSLSAKVDPTALIMPNVFIGNRVSIGKHCVIHPGVVIYDHTVIGDNVTIHANTTIGSDAFYYKNRGDMHDKMHSCGSVRIDDNVEIGAGCTVDRGVTDVTVIGAGSKLDNHIHIGHDTKIGKRCLFAAQVGISGCVTIGDRVSFWGQSGCTANVVIGDDVTVYAQSGVMHDIPAGETYFGSPAGPARKKYREMKMIERLGKE